MDTFEEWKARKRARHAYYLAKSRQETAEGKHGWAAWHLHCAAQCRHAIEESLAHRRGEHVPLHILPPEGWREVNT